MIADDDAARAAVEAAGLRVSTATRLSGGASALLWAVETEAGPAILRCPRSGDAGMAIGPSAEVRVLRAAATDGVPVPEVLAELPDGYLMRRLDGEALPKRLLRDERYAAARDRLVPQAAQALARIHTVPVGDLAIPTLGAKDQVDLLEHVHRSFGTPVPVFELALRWLRDHLPQPVPASLVHGDFRLGNLLVDEGGLVAVLDWELAHLGDPVEDLGWLCARAWRFGGPGEAAGLAGRDTLTTAYAEAGGQAVEPDRLRFWEVLAGLKWGVVCQVQAARHTKESPSLEHAVIGRRVTECELDLLLVLEEAA